MIARRSLSQSGRVAASVAAGLALVAGSLGGVVAESATPAALQPGQLTSVRPYLVPSDGSPLTFTPLITTGETVGDYQMAATPDGLGAYLDGDKAIVFMNHELTTEEGENLSGARVSRLVLDPETGAVESGSYVVDGTEGYERFCSAFLADTSVGFDAPIFFTGEESSGGKYGGIAVGIDGATGTVTQMPWLGHFDHENVIVVPGVKDKTVVLSTDDDSKGSELYMYVADSPADLMAGKGQLYVFAADGAKGTADVTKESSLAGAFVAIDQQDNVDAASLQKAADAAGAFTFVRLEDIATDKTTPTTVYFADTGDNKEPNLAADGTTFNLNGRIYTLTIDPADPTKVSGFGVLLDGDKGDPIKNPDNVATDGRVLVIQEDRNGYNRAEGSEDTGRIFAYDLAAKTLTPLAQIDQSDSGALADPDVAAGEWESSGIIDTSGVFGPGTWLATVQAHTLKVPQFGGEDAGGQLLLAKTK